MLCREVQNYISSAKGLPFFYVVGDEDYCSVLEELKQADISVVRMSDFCFEGKDDYFCFHAGTGRKGDQIVTCGGRVLGVTALGKDLKEAREKAYEAAGWVSFEKKYMRHDIGKAIDEA